MIVFTGTDWIDICGKFYQDILGQPAFMEAVAPHFTLLKLEYPKSGKLPKEEAAQKSFLAGAVYQAKGFPTVVLTDVEARPFGVNGFQPLPPAEYAAQILGIAEAHQARRALASEAGSLVGLERAKKLVESIPELPGILTARFYRREMGAILAADPENTLGLERDLLENDRRCRLQRAIASAHGLKWKEMIQLTDSYILEGKLEGEVLQRALMNKATVQRQLDDAVGYVSTLREVMKISVETETGATAKEQLENISKGTSPSQAPEKN